MSFFNLNTDKRRVKLITSATTIDVADCGTYFVLEAPVASAAYTITLPDLADAGPGWWCRFVLRASPLSDITIAANAGDGPDSDGTDLLVGHAWGQAADYGADLATADTLAFDTNAKLGAYIHVYSSGKTQNADQFWYVSALSDGNATLNKVDA